MAYFCNKGTQVMIVVVSWENKVPELTLFPHLSLLAETNSREKLVRLTKQILQIWRIKRLFNLLTMNKPYQKSEYVKAVWP